MEPKLIDSKITHEGHIVATRWDDEKESILLDYTTNVTDVHTLEIQVQDFNALVDVIDTTKDFRY